MFNHLQTDQSINRPAGQPTRQPAKQPATMTTVQKRRLKPIPLVCRFREQSRQLGNNKKSHGSATLFSAILDLSRAPNDRPITKDLQKIVKESPASKMADGKSYSHSEPSKLIARKLFSKKIMNYEDFQ